MKKYFLSGLAILLPIVLTIMIFLYVIDLFTAPFLNMVRNLLVEKGISHDPDLLTFLSRTIILIGLFLFTFLLGVIARWFFFRSILKITNQILSRIPIVRKIYLSSKDIFEAFFATDRDKTAFRHPIITPFPTKNSHAVAFVSGEVPSVCQEKVDEPLQSVFVPTAPHPISGYLLFVPKKSLHNVKMTNEEAVKFTVSCGVITQNSPEKKEADET